MPQPLVQWVNWTTKIAWVSQPHTIAWRTDRRHSLINYSYMESKIIFFFHWTEKNKPWPLPYLQSCLGQTKVKTSHAKCYPVWHSECTQSWIRHNPISLLTKQRIWTIEKELAWTSRGWKDPQSSPQMARPTPCTTAPHDSPSLPGHPANPHFKQLPPPQSFACSLRKYLFRWDKLNTYTSRNQFCLTHRCWDR